MEDGNAKNCGHNIYDNYQMSLVDCDRVNSIMESIVSDGRLALESEQYQILNS